MTEDKLYTSLQIYDKALTERPIEQRSMNEILAYNKKPAGVNSLTALWCKLSLTKAC